MISIFANRLIKIALEQVKFNAALEGGNAGYELIRDGDNCALYLRYAGSAEATNCGAPNKETGILIL